jgi:integrase
MVNIKLRGVAAVKAKGKTYYYAWRGGPRLRGEPGSGEFIDSFREAHENARMPDKRRFRSVVVRYKASPDFRNLADSTRYRWGPWLDRITDYFGDLSIAQFDRPEKIRKVIRNWRNQWADRPRTADYATQVLSRVLSYAVDPLGVIAGNPCEGIKQLYSADRAEIIWTAADLKQLKDGCPKQPCPDEIRRAVDLAAHTGLRLGDLVRLSWSHVRPEESAIVLATGKSRGRLEVVIPLYVALQAVLDGIPKRATTILTNTRRRPWTKNGLGTAFNRAKIAAGMNDRDLHFHDLRGTAATRFYTAGLSERVIAEIMGWEEEHVAKIIRRYVGRAAATRAIVRQLNQAERRT